jgi:hypothetical protein
MHFVDLDPSLVINYIAHQDINCPEGNSLLNILVSTISSFLSFHSAFAFCVFGPNNESFFFETKKFD